jgi:hypothetical protein
MVGLGAGFAVCVDAEPAPDFTFHESINTDTLRLSDFLEYPVLLAFFDAGNIAHARLFPYVREWNRRYHGDGLRTIGIHCPAFEPLKERLNALTVIARADIKLPVGLDLEWEVYGDYSLDALPTFIVLRPGGEIAFKTSGTKSFSDVESAIQELITERKPRTIHPFVMKPLRPIDDPDAMMLKPTAMILPGYASATIADCDSTVFSRYETYTDSREKQKEVVYLEGRWRVDEQTLSHENEDVNLQEHFRVIYSGKDVWLLAGFEHGKTPRIYIKQDRAFLPNDSWGRDVLADEGGRPYIHTRYAVPVHVVANPRFGAHELKLICASGDLTLYYLYFEGVLDPKSKSSR